MPPSAPLPDPGMRLHFASGVRVVSAAVVRGDLAEFAPAIAGPGWDRAVAFARGEPVGLLASEFVEGTPAADLIGSWAKAIGEGRALNALAWMWQAGAFARGEQAKRFTEPSSFAQPGAISP